MAIDVKIQDAINQQINHELTAAYNYLAMVVYFEELNLAGFASWMQKQHAEELVHANKLFQPCQLCTVRCKYGAIDRQGRIDYEECFQCLDCVTIKEYPKTCVPLVLAAKMAAREAAE